MAAEAAEKYDEEKDRDRVTEDPGFTKEASEMIMKAGQSKRVWKELYKVHSMTICVSRLVSKWYQSCSVSYLYGRLSGHRLGWRRCTGVGRTRSNGNTLETHRGVPQEGEASQTSRLHSEQVRPHTNLGYGPFRTLFNNRFYFELLYLNFSQSVFLLNCLKNCHILGIADTVSI